MFTSKVTNLIQNEDNVITMLMDLQINTERTNSSPRVNNNYHENGVVVDDIVRQ